VAWGGGVRAASSEGATGEFQRAAMGRDGNGAGGFNVMRTARLRRGSGGAVRRRLLPNTWR